MKSLILSLAKLSNTQEDVPMCDTVAYDKHNKIHGI